MKKLLISLVLAGALAVAPAASAQNISLSDFIELLIAAGVISPDKVEQARAVAKERENPLPSKRYCHIFDRNLRWGDRGEDIPHLHRILKLEGFEVPDAQGIFSEETAAAVSGFQQKYAGEVLKPYNLQYGTGFVGPATRSKLNALYGCKRGIPTPIPPKPVPITPVEPFPIPVPVIPVPVPPKPIYPYPLHEPDIKGKTPADNVSAAGWTLGSSVDRAGRGWPTDAFRSGAGGTGNLADWNWTLTLKISSGEKTIKGLDILHTNVGNEIWSTWRAGGIYPIVVDYNSSQIIKAYGDILGTYSAGKEHPFKLFGQRESEPFQGGTLYIYYTDNTYSKVALPAGGGITHQPSITV
ncbi:MAG: peptidoglycan-binding protein, partial [Candidatus Taylorbacteria bacterium]|nr:peptidoglycan-binding protein [Candidatus Taylorbacteria bacterium]